MAPMFEGMEGMEGMVGNTAGPNGGAGGFFPDRIDLPFVTTEYDGHPISEQRIWAPTFRLQSWSTEWYSWLVLTQFTRLSGWDAFSILPSWAINSDGNVDWNSEEAKRIVDGELKALVDDARDERPDALGEILAQQSEFVSYFLNLLSVSDSHPATARFLAIAHFVAGFCAIYYKGKYQRPRPTMLLPALLPPVSVPGHASFPSGHSTQAHLVAYCMIEVLKDIRHYNEVTVDLIALADRIARNRELAGLHYPSDTAAGVALAGDIWDLLQPELQAEKPPFTWFRLAYNAARAEWTS